MKVKKIAFLMVPVLVLLCASIAVGGTIVDYTYDADGNMGCDVHPPTVQIYANPETIPEGASSTLSWTSNNANTCEIDQGIGSVPISGTTTVSPTETTTYTITATGPGGTATDSVTVTVVSPPTVQISANPASIYEGESSTLTWSSTNAYSCEIQPDVGTVGTSGSTDVSPTETTTYTITATGPGGTATDSVIVTVAPSTPITITLRPNATGDHTGIPYQQPASGAHYNKVDEVNADGNTYVCTDSVEGYDLYGIPDHTTEIGVINYVKIYYRVALIPGTSAGYGFYKPAIKTGGTVYYGTQKIRTTTGWITYKHTWNTNPKTGAAWTWDDIDALQIGIYLRAAGYYPLVVCTQVYIQVNYTPSSS